MLAYVAAKYLKPAEEAKARERQACGQGGNLLPENLPEANKGDARDLAAAQVGLSGKTVDAAARAIERERGGSSPLAIGQDSALSHGGKVRFESTVSAGQDSAF